MPQAKERDDDIPQAASAYMVSVNEEKKADGSSEKAAPSPTPDECPRGPTEKVTTRILKKHAKWIVIAGIMKLFWGFLIVFCSFYLVKVILDVGTLKYAGLFFALCYLLGEALRLMSAFAAKYAMCVRNDLWEALYTRALWSKQDNSTETLALIITDCQTVFDSCTLFHYLWSGPLEALTICALTAWQLKVSSIPGIILLVIVISIQLLAGSQVTKVSDKREGIAKQRLGMIKEFIYSAKIVKLYVWETFFSGRIAELRVQEEGFIMRAAWLKIVSLAGVFILPPAMAVVMFSQYALTVQPIQATITFVVLSILNTLRFPLAALPKALKVCLEGYKALERIDRYCQDNPLPPEALEQQRQAEGGGSGGDQAQAPAGKKGVFLANVSNQFLKGITLSVPKGTCIGIQGKVGSGKSYLLRSIITNDAQAGSIEVCGSVGYVLQFPWLQNMSVRDNILFGLPYDKQWYDQVIQAVNLTSDLAAMPHGDEMSVGDKGQAVTASQRARISMARAFYRNADIYLFDNPLGSLDRQTARHVLAKGIRGLLRDKAVIFTSYNADHLSFCDRILEVDDGRLTDPDASVIAPVSDQIEHPHMAMNEKAREDSHAVEQREQAFRSLLSRKGSKRSIFGSTASLPNTESDRALLNLKVLDEIKKGTPPPRGGADSRASGSFSGSLKERAPPLEVASKSLTASVSSLPASPKGGPSGTAPDPAKEEPAPAPKKDEAGFLFWVRRGGMWTFVFLVILHATVQCVRALYDNQLEYWTRNYYHRSQNWYAWVQGCYAIGYLTGILLRGWAFYSYALRCSHRIHKRLVGTALYLPFQYFMSPTGTGAVISTYSRCISWVDDIFPDTVHLTIVYSFILLTTTILASTAIKWIGILIAVLCIAIPVALVFFLPASQRSKKEGDAFKSSIAAQVNESVGGVMVIRASGVTHRFVDDFLTTMRSLTHVEEDQAKQLYTLSFVLDNVGVILMAAIAFLVCTPAIRKSYTRAEIGLVITNALQAMVFYTWVVRGIGDTLYFASALNDIPNAEVGKGETPADEADMQAHLTAPGWHSGQIEFNDVWLRYDPSFPWVLRGFTYTVKPGSKIGIIGRSGAEKFSLINALFRLNDIERGSIKIDGTDIFSIGLHHLRFSLSIIPQEPVLFTGSIRTNIDPFHLYSDDVIWEALDQVELKGVIHDLNAPIQSHSFSMGTKQLLCMCRVLVKRPKILVLDEATSQSDHNSEQIMIDCLRQNFRETTILNIAHRVGILKGYDAVLRLANGVIEEVLSPDAMLSAMGSVQED